MLFSLALIFALCHTFHFETIRVVQVQTLFGVFFRNMCTFHVHPGVELLGHGNADVQP